MNGAFCFQIRRVEPLDLQPIWRSRSPKSIGSSGLRAVASSAQPLLMRAWSFLLTKPFVVVTTASGLTSSGSCHLSLSLLGLGFVVRLPHQGPALLGGAHRLGCGEGEEACAEAGELRANLADLRDGFACARCNIRCLPVPPGLKLGAGPRTPSAGWGSS
jgi:hypothetical protein